MADMITYYYKNKLKFYLKTEARNLLPFFCFLLVFCVAWERRIYDCDSKRYFFRHPSYFEEKGDMC